MRVADRIESAYVAVNATLEGHWGPVTEDQTKALYGAKRNLVLAYFTSTGRDLVKQVEDEIAAVRER